MDFNFSDFTDIEFPRHKQIVYILYFTENDSSNEIPLYVGESSRGVGRFGDYISANFKAPTDFKVGEAICYLRKLGFAVRIKYKEFCDRKNEEGKIISQLKRKSRLLNELKGLRYTDSNKDVERKKIHKFLDKLIQEKGSRGNEVKVQQSVTATRETDSSTRLASIPDIILTICKELGKGGKIILREDLLASARKLGINSSSVLPADYCDNTVTGKWSKHSFLRSVGRGKYVLKSLNSNAENGSHSV